jgi:hypothetical protein
MDYLDLKVSLLLEQIADGYGSTLRSSCMPTSIEEGGLAFKTAEGVIIASRIPREFVPFTLRQVVNLLEKSGFIDTETIQPVGSTLYLSKETLGDMDLLVKPVKPFDEVGDFKNTIYDWIYLEGYPIRDLAEKGRDFLFDMFSFLFPIIDNNNQLTGKQVQVDLILAENDTMYVWRYHWYESPKTSAWKGAARNILIGVIASVNGYSWTKSGLYKYVKRQDVWGMSEEKEFVTADPHEASTMVFGQDIGVTESVETMMDWLSKPEQDNIRSEVMSKFNGIIAEYEAEGREMRNTQEEAQ